LSLLILAAAAAAAAASVILAEAAAAGMAKTGGSATLIPKFLMTMATLKWTATSSK
jgi:hypothetical protein